MVASLLINEVLGRRAHYVRLTPEGGDKRPPMGIAPPEQECAVASARWICYDCERVFEIVPDMLATIHQEDRSGWVIIEADADPVLRHAYPYDQQLFVLPAQASLRDVFRSAHQAARALQDVLDDTAEFASEVFGVSHGGCCFDDDTRADRELLTGSQIRRFLDSPLGDDLAARIQLRPEYHGLVESDVVLINTAVGGSSRVVEASCRRLETLLSRIEAPAAERGAVFRCDPGNCQDPNRCTFIESLRILCSQAG